MHRLILIIAAAALTFGLAGPAGAELIDLYQQFPLQQGDSHLYALAAGGGVYRQLDKNLGIPPDPYYQFGFYTPKLANPPDPYYAPYMYKGAEHLAGWVVMQPSSAEAVVLGWSVPPDPYSPASLCSLAATFQGSDGGSVRVFVALNGQVLVAKDIAGTAQAMFTLAQLYLVPGDHLYLGVDSLGDNTNDVVWLQGQITAQAVPLPGALLLLGAGLLRLGLHRRRRGRG